MQRLFTLLFVLHLAVFGLGLTGCEQDQGPATNDDVVDDTDEGAESHEVVPDPAE